MEKEYFIYLNNEIIKVSEKIYKVYWKEKEHKNI